MHLRCSGFNFLWLSKVSKMPKLGNSSKSIKVHWTSNFQNGGAVSDTFNIIILFLSSTIFDTSKEITISTIIALLLKATKLLLLGLQKADTEKKCEKVYAFWHFQPKCQNSESNLFRIKILVSQSFLTIKPCRSPKNSLFPDACKFVY